MSTCLLQPLLFIEETSASLNFDMKTNIDIIFLLAITKVSSYLNKDKKVGKKRQILKMHSKLETSTTKSIFFLIKAGWNFFFSYGVF